MTWTAAGVEAKVWHRHDSIESAREFCLRHGEDPDAVALIEYDVVGLPLLRFTLYVKDAEGRAQLNLDAEPGTILTTTVEHALIGALPEWWTPTQNGATA